MSEQSRHPGKLDVDDRQPSTPADEAGTTLLQEEVTPAAAESPVGVEDYGVTAAEEASGEPLGERLRRELPDITAGHRPADPDRVAAAAFAGRFVAAPATYSADGAGPDIDLEEAEADGFDLGAEEAAMHLTPWPREPKPPRGPTHGDRLELLEAEVAVLVTVAKVHSETLRILTDALRRTPTEEPGDAADRISRSAQEAHALLTTLRQMPR